MSTTPEETTETTNAEKFLLENYPDFWNILQSNEDVLKTLREKYQTGYTVFAPNAAAFENLGEQRRQQLSDPRNDEIVHKTAAYHVINDDAIRVERLLREDWTRKRMGDKPALKVGSLVTMGGQVPIGRSKSGGFFKGIGATEDGGVDVGPNAVIQKSFLVGEHCIVHETDALVSPEILWRYCDQLRIPGF